MYLLTQRFPKPLVMLIGLVLMGISILLIAQSSVFGITPTSTMIVMGLLLLGGASPMISIPIMPEMLESIEKRTDLNFDPEIVNNLSSSLFVTMTGLGEAIGPVLNSILIDKYGFTLAHEIYAYIMLGMAVLYFLATGPSICKYEYTGEKETESEMTKS
jgi:MFS family permease